MASIEYAEIVVNTELPEYTDVANVFGQDAVGISRAPRVTDTRRSEQQRGAGRTARAAGEPRKLCLGA